MIVKNFWFEIIEKFNILYLTQVEAVAKDVILHCYSHDDDVNVMLTIVYLYGKKYIMNCKIRKNMPNLNMFMEYMLEHLKILSAVKMNCRKEYDMVTEFINSI